MSSRLAVTLPEAPRSVKGVEVQQPNRNRNLIYGGRPWYFCQCFDQAKGVNVHVCCIVLCRVVPFVR